MSVKVIRALLVANSALIAVVPAARIAAGTLPQGTTLPAISIEHVSTVDHPAIDGLAVYSLVTSRIQVVVMATTYPQVIQVLDLARKACNYKRGTVASETVVSVTRDSTGFDSEDAEAGILYGTVDFKVVYQETN